MRISPFRMPVTQAAQQTRAAGVEAAGPVRAISRVAEQPKPVELDGMLLGANGQAYPRDTPYTQVPPTKPSNGKSSDTTVIFVNGMGESPEASTRQARHIADATGMNVVNVYNATQGAVRDLLQAAGDTFDLGTNKAVDSLADQLYPRLMAGESVRLISHSQGALITSRALTDVRNRMVAEGGLTREQAEQKLGGVGVETLGGAAPSWPDGPAYVHYVNRSDFVPSFLGVGRPMTDPGKDAKIVTFGRFNPFGGWFGGSGHDTATYLKHYVPFDEASRS